MSSINDWVFPACGCLCLMVVCLFGCQDGKLTLVPERSFSGSITINQTNGEIERVTIDFPDSVTIDSRKDFSNLLEEVKALVLEMESARDRMKIIEPKAKK